MSRHISIKCKSVHCVDPVRSPQPLRVLRIDLYMW